MLHVIAHNTTPQLVCQVSVTLSSTGLVLCMDESSFIDWHTSRQKRVFVLTICKQPKVSGLEVTG